MKYWILSVAISFFASSALGNECLHQKYKKYVDLQTQWQHDYSNLMVANHPELKEVTYRYRDTQLALIEQRFIAFTIYVADAPEKIQTEKPLNQWLVLNPSIKNELSLQYPKFKIIDDKVELYNSLGDHKDGDNAREVFRSEIAPSQEFSRLLSRFNSNVSVLNDTSCPTT
ncbi:hypothetical protein [Neptunomonas phycophila]|uniref:hypothetical protein n=1 Tax=Neptunomonas phycophila TaxID=1572645 RepID=UPI000948B092|nr:hypothetical protein [Neptunomonas phycophila]